ncbi:hypothetical protein QBC47DRAFT_95922 [Echria macrotheca]|uniref:Uncharacterized protein n=1 Tax=Echria macrotheca TaxID=438768 RepID=A0AAJ0BIC1_9PEZI|nr:hypothetical protein QBC47DRAFT_95922 [Echria macrotheca]
MTPFEQTFERQQKFGSTHDLSSTARGDLPTQGTLAPSTLQIPQRPPAPTAATLSDAQAKHQWPQHQHLSSSRSPTRDKHTNAMTIGVFGHANRSKAELSPPRPAPLRLIFPNGRKPEIGQIASGPIPPQQLTKRSMIRKPSRRRALANSCDVTEKPLFACPFYLLYPQLHHGCRLYVLKRIKDVRQHLSRNHRRPADCPPACDTLDTAEHHEHHQRGVEPSGDLSHRTHSSYVSLQQWDRIAQQAKDPSSKTKPPEEQWIEIWEVLFPETVPPRSVFMSSDGFLDNAQIMCRLRRFWVSRRTQVIDQTMQRTGPVSEMQPGRIVDIINEFAHCFLDQFEADIAADPRDSVVIRAGLPKQAPLHHLVAQMAECDDSASTTSTTTEGLSLSSGQLDDGGPQTAWNPCPGETFAPWTPDRHLSPLPYAYATAASLTTTAQVTSGTFNTSTLSEYDDEPPSVEDACYGGNDTWAIQDMMLVRQGHVLHGDLQQQPWKRQTWHGPTSAPMEF